MNILKLFAKENNYDDKRVFFKLILLTFSASIIFGLPYFRHYYYDVYKDFYNLTNTKIGMLGSIYGFFGFISYIFGGILADKIPVKKLIVFSLISTGLTGFLHLFFTSYHALLIIYALWGITTQLTFWPALIKAVRMLGSSEIQGRLFGIFEGGRGVISSIHLSLALSVFSFTTYKINDNWGLSGIILFYSIASISSGILCCFTLKETTSLKNKKLDFKRIKYLLQNPAIWLMSLMLASSYTYNMSFYYFTPYASQIFETTTIMAASLTVLAQFVRPLAATTAGFVADKIGRSKVMMICFIFMAISTLGVIFISNAQNMIIYLTLLYTLVYISMYANYGIIFSLMSESNIQIEDSGLAIGIISTVGYLPEILCPLIAGGIFDNNPGRYGYQLYFGGMVFMAFLGFVVSTYWNKKYNQNNY